MAEEKLVEKGGLTSTSQTELVLICQTPSGCSEQRQLCRYQKINGGDVAKKEDKEFSECCVKQRRFYLFIPTVAQSFLSLTQRGSV